MVDLLDQNQSFAAEDLIENPVIANSDAIDTFSTLKLYNPSRKWVNLQLFHF